MSLHCEPDCKLYGFFTVQTIFPIGFGAPLSENSICLERTSSMKSFLLKNIILLNSEEDRPYRCNMYIRNGKIEAVGCSVTYDADVVLDMNGCYVSPAFIDLHVHLRDPGFTHKEDLVTGTRAAAAGGFGSVFCMPNTSPVTDNADTLRYILQKANSEASCRVFPIASITVGQSGRLLCDMQMLSENGAAAFSDDGRPVESASLMRAALREAKKCGSFIISHCEDLSLAANGCINEGEISRQLGISGIPNSSEEAMVARELVLAEETGAHIHLAHISTKGSVQLIREAKTRGVPVTCETCPHYFSLTEENVRTFGVMAKMNPPLRTEDDRLAIIRGLRDGTIDCIATDHAPHTTAEKGNSLTTGANGIIGLQTAFSIAFTYLVKPGYLTLPQLIDKITAAPARISGLYQRMGLGKLIVGAPADIVFYRPEADFVLMRENNKSKSENTPYFGMKLNAAVESLMVNGIPR